MVWGLASVGGLAVVAGVISLVAANWDEIPDKVKLAGGMTALLGLALAAREVGERGDGWIRDLLLLVHQGMVLAMIGLVAQVYHLSGHPWRAMALGCALAVPPVLAGRRALLGDVALYFALQSLWFYLDEIDVLDRLFDTGQMAFVSIALGLALATAGPALGRYEPVTRRWALGLIGLPLAAATYMWSMRHGAWLSWRERGGESWAAAHWPLLLLAATAAVAGIAQARRRPRDVATFATAVLAALLVVGAVHQPEWSPLARKVVGFGLFCGMATAFTFASAARGSRAGVNLGSLALATRILVLFLELFDDLTRTGLGLIITGVLLVGIAYGWWRLRVLVPVVGAPAAGPGGKESEAP